MKKKNNFHNSSFNAGYKKGKQIGSKKGFNAAKEKDSYKFGDLVADVFTFGIHSMVKRLRKP